MAKKKNWDFVRKQRATDTAKYRDVYEDQQLERGELGKKQTMTGRAILAGIAGVFVGVAAWGIVTAADMFFSKPKVEINPNPEYAYIHCNEHYVNVDDSSDKITPEEYEMREFNYDPDLPEKEKPNKSDFDDKEAYNEALEEYNEYNQRRIDPSVQYKHQNEHYRYIGDTSEILSVSGYKEAVEKYKQDVASNKISADLLDVPVRVLDPANLYKATKWTKDADGEDKAYEYRQIFDGSIISYYDFDMMKAEYDAELEDFNEAWLAHRKKYHPDNIDGKARIMDWGFTTNKLIAFLVLGGATFGILFSILQKNLKSQNALTDPSDINQYHNDQHIALPEEVQKNYDWFPDVGAHSAVSPSSMISHMALTNKGLKTVKLARRAKADVINEDGTVECYKGAILYNENGEPLTDDVPMIDTDFMEDLFEASGAPDDKAVRKRYDTTKIPYNPGNENRDKLQNKTHPYATVADLINNDWEFPEYEPQRPGGAYIVDTAPVNTMVLAITRAGKGQTVIE